MIWPAARRAFTLLEGAKVQFDNAAPMVQGHERTKRQADDAFGREKSSEILSREAFSQAPADETPGIDDVSTRIMAHMLGLDIPGIEASTSYYPGYEWWPRSGLDGSSDEYPSPFQTNGPTSFDQQPSIDDWLRSGQGSMNVEAPNNYLFDFSGMSNNFGM